MNRYGKRCVLYPRVSTEMQVDGYSLEGQKNMLTRFADREEMIVVDTYEDAGKSGKSIEGRPAFQKMLRDIEDGLDIDYILVYKLSRFGRNAADILNSLELVQSYGVNLICIEEGIDSSQTSGKLLISVLSAVAEIERENIIEQTMNGRREKARQGGWNGGFAPYGYTLEDNKLMIEETEAVAIRKIFELYTSSEIGLGGIANQLNLQGIRKIPRQNGTLEDWTGHFIKLILDNPVYCGKIAYGRRTKEKVKGTKNDYQMKRNDDYILTEGQHKGIVSEEVWEKAHAKRLRTGVKQPSKIGRDRVHLLSGLLKCPVCGSPMYTNKHAWTNKDGTYKEIYYYVCSRNRMVRGKHCEYKAMLKKTDIEPMVIEAIREIVRNEEYAQAIKKRIGVQIDTKAVDKELEGYQAKLKEVDLNKTRLEREIDSLPADAKYRERKLHDMTLRLDSLYDVIVELEEKIEDARLRRDAIKQQAITLENIYKIMVNFDCVYNIINDEEKRNVVTALIKEIEIYRNDESEYPLKRIGLNFPVFKDGGEVTELLWDKGNTVETDVGVLIHVLVISQPDAVLQHLVKAAANEVCALHIREHHTKSDGKDMGFECTLAHAGLHHRDAVGTAAVDGRSAGAARHAIGHGHGRDVIYPAAAYLDGGVTGIGDAGEGLSDQRVTLFQLTGEECVAALDNSRVHGGSAAGQRSTGVVYGENTGIGGADVLEICHRIALLLGICTGEDDQLGHTVRICCAAPLAVGQFDGVTGGLVVRSSLKAAHAGGRIVGSGRDADIDVAAERGRTALAQHIDAAALEHTAGVAGSIDAGVLVGVGKGALDLASCHAGEFVGSGAGAAHDDDFAALVHECGAEGDVDLAACRAGVNDHIGLAGVGAGEAVGHGLADDLSVERHNQTSFFMWGLRLS
mgnify:CR=1 FL=1